MPLAHTLYMDSPTPNNYCSTPCRNNGHNRSYEVASQPFMQVQCSLPAHSPTYIATGQAGPRVLETAGRQPDQHTQPSTLTRQHMF